MKYQYTKKPNIQNSSKGEVIRGQTQSLTVPTERLKYLLKKRSNMKIRLEADQRSNCTAGHV